MNKGLSNECENFRERFLEGNASCGDVHVSASGCDQCRSWSTQMDSISAAAENLTQFAVPERVTQQIMAVVEEEIKSPAVWYETYMIPLAVACLAVLLFFAPIDSLEGCASTALGLIVLAGANLLIRASARQEPVA